MRVAEGIADTLAASGATTAAPAAGTTIATLAAPPAGVYAVIVTTNESGTVDTNGKNAQLKKGSSVVVDLFTAATPSRVDLTSVTLDGSTALVVVTGAAIGGAGSIYNATIAATRVA